MSPSRPADPEPPSNADPVLTRERDHLFRSRESLARMRAVARTAGDVGGDSFSSEALGAAGPAGSRLSPTTRPSRRSSAGSTARPNRSARTARPSTSAAGTSGTTPGTRWSSTGGRRCRARSTGPPRPSRWACGAGAGSASPPARSPRTRTNRSLSTTPPRSARSRAAFCCRRSSALGWDRCGTSSPPSSRTRTTSSGPSSSRASACRGRPAPARRRSACTAPRISSTPIPDRLRRSGVLVVGPNRAFLDYIGRCSRRSARSA